VQLDLPEMLSEGPQHLATLAGRALCHELSLLWLMRALTSIEIVEEQQDGRFGLTDAGRLLRVDVRVRWRLGESFAGRRLGTPGAT
jgi:hypothetical protein